MRIKHLFFIVLFFSFGQAQIFAQDAGAPGGVVNRKQISGGVINGRAVNLVQPAYPAAAKAVKAQGAVNVQVTLDEEGNVISASAVSGHPLLRAAAVEAARQSKFKPTIQEGKPVKATGVIIFNFVLPGEANLTTPNRIKEYDQLTTMGMVMFLTAMKDIPGDAESNEILLDLGDELPASIKTDKKLFEKVVGAKTQGERASAINEIITQMRGNLTGTDAWLVDLGAQWGGAIGEAFRISGSNYQRDRKDFVKNLQGMSWLLEAPPKELSEASLSRIRAAASYNTETDSITPEFINDFFRKSLEFMEYMIGESKKRK